MTEIEEDNDREHRIDMEIVVDAYDEEERAMGWYYYLENMLTVPFHAECIAKRRTSPLKIGDEVQVIGMTSEDDCMKEMFVTIRWNNEDLAVPLSQLGAVNTDAKTLEAVKDWHYWVKRGYAF